MSVVVPLYTYTLSSYIGSTILLPGIGSIILNRAILYLNVILGVAAVGVAIDILINALVIYGYGSSISSECIPSYRRLGTAVSINAICIITDRAVGDRGISTLTVDPISGIFNDTAFYGGIFVIRIVPKIYSTPSS